MDAINAFLNNYKINQTQYVKGEKLGNGAFGTVYLCDLKTINIKAAMKELRPFADIHEQKAFLKELYNLAKLQHPGCLRLIGYNLQPPTTKPDGTIEYQGPIIFTPYLEKGSMDDFIKEVYCPLLMAYIQTDEPDILMLLLLREVNTILMISLYGICRALKYLHSKNMIHRDLKPENVLYNTFYYPILADFGLTIDKNKDEENAAGSPLFMAPEAFVGEFDFKSDIFSFGMVIYYIFYVLYGSGPFLFEGQRKPPQDLRVFYAFRQNGVLPYKYKGFPPLLWQLVEKCLNPEVSERPSADDLVKFFENPDNRFADIDEDAFNMYVQNLNFEELRVFKPRSRTHYYTHVDPPVQE